jgi:hypothetical protein
VRIRGGFDELRLIHTPLSFSLLLSLLLLFSLPSPLHPPPLSPAFPPLLLVSRTYLLLLMLVNQRRSEVGVRVRGGWIMLDYI